MTLGFIAEFSFLVLHCQTEPRNFLYCSDWLNN